MSSVSYLDTFYWIVTSGWGCGLTHPIEWAVNAQRTPGGTLSPSYYEKIDRHMPRFLVNMYECEHMTTAGSADELLRWCYAHYEDGRFDGFFDYLKDEIEGLLAEGKA